MIPTFQPQGFRLNAPGLYRAIGASLTRGGQAYHKRNYARRAHHVPRGAFLQSKGSRAVQIVQPRKYVGKSMKKGLIGAAVAWPLFLLVTLSFRLPARVVTPRNLHSFIAKLGGVGTAFADGLQSTTNTTPTAKSTPKATSTPRPVGDARDL